MERGGKVIRFPGAGVPVEVRFAESLSVEQMAMYREVVAGVQAEYGRLVEEYDRLLGEYEKLRGLLEAIVAEIEGGEADGEL